MRDAGKRKGIHRRGAEDAEREEKKNVSWFILCDLCASAVSPIL